MCCHTETAVADRTFYLTQSQYTDSGPTSLNANPIAPGWVATEVSMFRSLVQLDLEKDQPLLGRTP